MSKIEKKIYLERDELDALQKKANEMGFTGKGYLSHYLASIAKSPLIILDNNTKTMLKALSLK